MVSVSLVFNEKLPVRLDLVLQKARGNFDFALRGVHAEQIDGTLGRDVYRGPRQTSTNLALARNFGLGENKTLQARIDAFNAFNNVNLFLPAGDLALALKADGTYSSTSVFGKSTQAFDPRILQLSARIAF